MRLFAHRSPFCNCQEPGEYLTTNQGVRVNNTNDSLKAGSRGPTLMEDFHFQEFIQAIAKHRDWMREEKEQVPA